MAPLPPIRLAVTPGEPAGIGPELAVQVLLSDECRALREEFRARCDGRELELILVADPDLLKERAAALGASVHALPFEEVSAECDYRADGVVPVLAVPLSAVSVAGKADPRNASYVLATLEHAVAGTLGGEFHAVVTGPVNKALINEAGHPFTGHTEWLAHRTDSPLPVMMLATRELRVALATTHLPLRDVPDAITRDLLQQVVRILHRDLHQRFGIDEPRILVCGLNPHAGEGGHLGSEEEEVIGPAIAGLVREGMRIEGPLPADTVFTPHHLNRADVVLAMYHDQGLAPLKQVAFGRAVNVTLGLPIVRTSVDHGTAFDLAGTGRADPGSLLAAIRYGAAMATGLGSWL